VAWVHIDRQTILTIGRHVITRNPRVNIIHDTADTLTLQIKDVQAEDKGFYMCQVNTDPIISQTVYLDVVVPPTIIDEESSPTTDSIRKVEEPSYENCSLVSHLYTNLRQSETHYTRFRNLAMMYSNMAADGLTEGFRSSYDREYRFSSQFRHPAEYEFSYKLGIDLAVNSSLDTIDSFRSSPETIARAEMGLDVLVSNLFDERMRKRYQFLMMHLVRQIKPDTWPYLASCLYEAFKENQDSNTLSRVVTNLVSNENFEKFNLYFKAYVGDIGRALKKALESEETLDMVHLIYELTKSEMRSIDYNNLLTNLRYFVLQLKAVLVKPDFQELYAALNQTDHLTQEVVWKLQTGRWPEMTTFVDNFLRRTIGSILFWDRLTSQFPIEMKTEISEMMEELVDDINIEDAAETVLEKLNYTMNMVAYGDEVSIRRLFQDIRASKWDETLTSYIEFVAEELTSCNLATLASYLPSYDVYRTTMRNSKFLRPVKTLLFKDWPQDSASSAQDIDFLFFNRRIYDNQFSILEAIFGRSTCNHDY